LNRVSSGFVFLDCHLLVGLCTRNQEISLKIGTTWLLFHISTFCAGHWWLTPVIQEAEMRRNIEAALANSLQDPISKKIYHKKELVEWLNV
jgi:uncharacterized membrane protein